MSKQKIKKIVAIVLAISIIMGIMAVCTGLFAGAAGNNLLKNGGFESTYGMWNEAAQNSSGNNGYTGKKIGIGQHNLIAEGWMATNERGTRITLDHTTDSKEGSFAIKFNIPSALDTVPVKVYPKVDSVDVSEFTSGGNYYKFTAWVKGTNNTSYFEIKTTDGKTYTQAITPGQTWHKVSLDNVYLSKSVSLAAVNSDRGYHIAIVVDKDTAEETELYIDNLSLTLTDNILPDGGFEKAATTDGFENFYVGRGQTNMITNSFLGYHSYESGKKDVAAIAIDHTTKGRSGYALHFKMPAYSGTTMNVFPYDSELDLSKVKEGYYTFAVWVKGTTDKAKLIVETNDQKYETAIPRSMDWQRVAIDNIYLADNASNLKAYRPDSSRKPGYAIKLYMATTVDYKTELVVDDISLTPIEFMTNADFENGNSGWVGSSTSGATSNAVELADAKSGKSALKLSLPAQSGITVSEVSLPKTDLTQGFYMLAFWAKGSGTLSAQTVQDSDNSTLDCTLSNEWQLFVQKDIVVDSGELNTLKFVAENTGTAAAEIYLDNIQFYRQVGPGGFIDSMTAKINKRGELMLTVPPEGYEITILSSSNEGVIALDGAVTLPTEETTVDLVLKMTNINDATDTAKSETVTVNVPTAGGNEGETTDKPFIINGGFEGNTIKLNTTSGGVNYTDRIGRGQTNTVVDGWNGFNWWEGDNIANAPSFSMSAGRSGNDSLKVTSPAGQKNSSVFFYPVAENLDKSGIVGGKYKLSAWVRGTNTHADNVLRFAALEADGKTVKEYTASITSGEEWHEIVINDIYLTPNGENLQNIKVNGSGASPLVIQLKGVNGSETYLEFDDITLTRIGDAGALKDDAILQNGSFERNGIGLWGFEDKTFPKNQCNYIIEGWRSNQWADSNIPTAVSHITDANDGKYSLKFDVPVGANTLTMVPDTTAVDTTKITEGFYNLTFYTKGINSKSSIKVKTTSSYGSTAEKVYEAKINPSLDWQQVTIENIYLTAGGANLAKASTAWENGSKEITAKHIAFAITADTQDTEIYIDNIALEKAANSDQQLTAIIKKGDFEGSTILLNHSSGQPIVGSGQPNEIVAGWEGCNWTNGTSDSVKLSMVAGRNGGSALRADSPAAQQTWEPLYITAAADNINTANITEGYYTLSVWVRSTLSGDKAIVAVRTTDKDYTANITAGEEWHEIKVENIYLTANGANMSPYKCYSQDLSSGIAILVDGNGSSATYLEIDDITLTKGEAPTPDTPSLPTGTEYLKNTSFETTTQVWNTPENKSGWDGFTDRQVKKGQSNVLVDDWRFNRWNSDNVHPYVTHTTESHTGTYALKFRVPAGCAESVFYPRADKIDLSGVQAGYYVLSVWVKGTNTASSLSVKCTSSATGNSEVTYTQSIPASNDWTLVTLDNIYLTAGAANLANYGGNTAGPAIRVNIKAASGATADTEIFIDDISLKEFKPENTVLSNTSFETTTQVWNTPANKSGWDGFTDRQVKKGQSNVLVDDWRFNRWNSDTVHPYVTHTTDKHTGTYALKFRIPAGCAESVLYPRADKIDLSSVQAGYYTLSLWVKGTNTASSLSVKCTSSATGNGEITYTQSISASNDWILVTLDNIYLTDGAANLANYGGNTAGPAIRVNIKAASGTTADTELYIDDISLTKVQ